jgi:toxin ParE1/3/4
MTSAVKLLAIAEADMAEAKEWYHQCHPCLEADLILSIEETLTRIACLPLSFPRLNGEFRQAFVHRFLYPIVFRMVGDLVVVVAILPTSPHPPT